MKKDAQTTYLTIAKIGAPYGVRGWLKIQAFTEYTESAVDYQPWFVEDSHGRFSALAIEKVECQHGRLLAKLQGVESPEEARLFTGKLLSIPRDVLPALKENEYYWSDLEGLTVINHRGETLGTVSYLLETGANDVIVIKGDRQQLAIPYLPGRVVKEVNLAKQEMHVEWDVIE